MPEPIFNLAIDIAKDLQIRPAAGQLLTGRTSFPPAGLTGTGCSGAYLVLRPLALERSDSCTVAIQTSGYC